MNAGDYFGILLAMENNAEAEREYYERERRKASKPGLNPDGYKDKIAALRGRHGGRR